MDCIFCKIIKGEIPSYKVWEDEDFLAILDVNPNTKGMTLVLPKRHYSSYVFDMPDDVYTRLMNASKKVAKLLDRKLGVEKTAMVMEGMGINHAHIKLYPLCGLSKKFKPMVAEDKVYFNKYEGYLTTKMGPRADDNILRRLVKKITE